MTGNGNIIGTTPPAAAGAALLSFQTDILDRMSSEIVEMEELSAANGGEFLIDSDRIRASLQARDISYEVRESAESSVGRDIGRAAAGWERPIGISDENTNTARVGGLLPGLGECDAVLVLADGSRLPVHACLLAAFSGAFRDLFLRPSGSRRYSNRGCCDNSNRSPACAPGEKPPMTVPSAAGGGIGGSASSTYRNNAAAFEMSTEVVPAIEEAGGIGGCNFVEEDNSDTSRGTNVASVESTTPLVGPTVRDLRTVVSVDGRARTLPEAAAVAVAREDTAPTANTTGDVAAPPISDAEDRRVRASAVYALLVEHHEPKSAAAEIATRATISSNRKTSAMSRVLCEEEADVAAEHAAATTVAALGVERPDGATATWQRSAVVGWGAARGEVWIRFWGASVVAALVRHCYCGRPPTNVRHPGKLAKLLVAAASLQMTRCAWSVSQSARCCGYGCEELSLERFAYLLCCSCFLHGLLTVNRDRVLHSACTEKLLTFPLRTASPIPFNHIFIVLTCEQADAAGGGPPFCDAGPTTKQQEADRPPSCGDHAAGSTSARCDGSRKPMYAVASGERHFARSDEGRQFIRYTYIRHRHCKWLWRLLDSKAEAACLGWFRMRVGQTTWFSC